MERESNEAILRALSKVFISESLFVSLLCLRSSEGFRVMMTVTMRMARNKRYIGNKRKLGDKRYFGNQWNSG